MTNRSDEPPPRKDRRRTPWTFAEGGRRVIDTNLTEAFLGMKTVHPGMINTPMLGGAADEATQLARLGE